MGKFNLNKLQDIIREEGLSGWLLYDFRGSNDLALDLLDFPKNAHLTRRFFYFIPANGTPKKIVNAIETHNLKHLPGDLLPYASHVSLKSHLTEVLRNCSRVAMEYSPMNTIPYLSKVDAGTIEAIKSLGIDIVPSGDLITSFTATWTDDQYKENVPVANALTHIVQICFDFIKSEIKEKGETNEFRIQQLIMTEFEKRGYFTDHSPIVAVNANSANPHYSPDAENFAPIKEGDFVLIDLWAKVDADDGVWSDITWTGFVGETIPDKYTKIFNIVRDARDAAFNLVTERFDKKKPVFGFELDQVARDVIAKAGYANYFIHRTGHSITTELHGSGPHLDNFETKDERQVLPATSFSIEPGIYLTGDFGVRSEIDVYIHPDGKVEQTGGKRQMELVAILS